VDIYIASSEFSRQKFVQGGLPAKKIQVKPNFVAETSASPELLGQYALVLGRLSREKGLGVLLSAWKKLSDIPLMIIGDGPLRDSILERIQNQPLVNYLGYLARGSLQEMMRSARMIILPSVCYENFPIVVAEASALGIPVIASRLGTMAEVVRDGESGLLFNPGDAEDLAAKVRWLWDHIDESARMGRLARLEYEQKYTPERNYQLLMKIYSKAMRGS